MPHRGTNYFHLHLVSDATGETLITVARAAAAQYASVSPVEHMHPLVRTHKQLDRVLDRDRERAGDRALHAARSRAGRAAGKNLPRSRAAVSVHPRSGAEPVPGLSRRRDQAARRRAAHAQRRIFQAHRCARTTPCCTTTASTSTISSRPTSCWSASRAPRRRRPRSISPTAASRPPTFRWCRACRCRRKLETLAQPLVVGLTASPERIVQIRQNRLLGSASRARRRPIRRSAGGGGGDRLGAQALRQAQLADHRRDAALDRGDRRGGDGAAGRSPPAVAG